MEQLLKINNWFKSQCDGDWEHENGIKIYTTDNPGWGVSIDIRNTHLKDVITEFKHEKSELNWFHVISDGESFKGYGGVDNLKDIFSFFLTEFLPQNQNDFIYEIYGQIKDTVIPIWRKYESHLLGENIYVIRTVPDFDYKELKFENFEGTELIDFEMINKLSEYKIGDKVICELKIFADNIENVIVRVVQ